MYTDTNFQIYFQPERMEPPETIPKLDSNSVTNRKLEEYSTQFLNFTPRSFVDGCKYDILNIKNKCNHTIH